MSDGETKGKKLDAQLARLERLTEDMVRDLDPPGPYVTVRVAIRTPGGTKIHLDYDADDAAVGELGLERHGLEVIPGPNGLDAEEIRRLKAALDATAPRLDTYVLSRVVRAVAPEDDTI